MEAELVVLIVEDEPIVQILLDDTLVEAGFTVAKASNGDDAIKTLNEQASQIRALITDINLGSATTGWDVARHARKIIHDLPVIFTTTANAADWTSLGVPKSLLITKPYSPSQIVTAVSQLLNDRTTQLVDD
jgi:CheY-like chemotaxis protein